MARRWKEEWLHDADRAMVDFDQSNAHNTVDRTSFLQRAQQIIPGTSRWLRWIYPLDRPTFVFYDGHIIESWCGGQQGCPLIGACHAMVQRAVPESLGLCDVHPATEPLIPFLLPALECDALAMFADDGFLAGRQHELRRGISHLQTHMPDVGLEFSKLDVIPARPHSDTLDGQAFTQLGCTILWDGNAELVKSPVGTADWCNTAVLGRVQKLGNVCKALATLPSEEAALYLLRYQASRMIYTVRTTPSDCCSEAVKLADGVVKTAAEAILGETLLPLQAARVYAPSRMGGYGLPRLGEIADAAYLASATAARIKIDAIHDALATPHRAGDPDQATTDLAPAVADPRIQDAATRVARHLPGGLIALAECRDDDQCYRQQRVTLAIQQARHQDALRDLSLVAAASVQAHSAPYACRWLLEPPQMRGPTAFPFGHFTQALRSVLGSPLTTVGFQPMCKFCGALRDNMGIHDLSCTAGGDMILRHNDVRNAVFGLAQRAQVKAVLEKAGLLSEPGVLLELRRPADVLIETVLARTTTDESLPFERAALDIKVVNALGRDYIDATRADPLAATELYHAKAMQHEDTATRCAAQGITYIPMVFTAQGGIGKRAEAVLHQLAARAAPLEHKKPDAVFAEVAIDISRRLARHAAKAILRRGGTSRPHAACARPRDALLDALDAGTCSTDIDEASLVEWDTASGGEAADVAMETAA